MTDRSIPWKAATWPLGEPLVLGCGVAVRGTEPSRVGQVVHPLQMVTTFSSELRWDKRGRAHGRSWHPQKEARPRFERRPGMDFGTSMGDLIIPPWAQDAINGRPGGR